MTQTNAKTEITLDIDRLAYGAYGIGRHEGKAVMVPHTAPGDTVSARIIESKERYSIGELTRLIHPSRFRQIPPCPYVGHCGGCSWQHLRYDAQLKAKQQNVEDALRRIGKLDGFEMRPIMPSPDEWHYRRRVRLQADGQKNLGFYGAGSYHLIEIDDCLIAAEPLNELIAPLRRWIANLSTAVAQVEIINGDKADELVVVLQATDILSASDEDACENFLAPENHLAGLIVHSREGRRIWGRSSITVMLQNDLSLELDADVFTQVNGGSNRHMIESLLTLGNFHEHDGVLELYAGAGNFTLPIARRVKDIVAVEGTHAAITNAKLNAQRYNLENISWHCAAVPQAVAQLKRQRKKFSKIVLDPPRTGAKGIETDLAALSAATICYISCNPTTMARDLAALTKHGYKLRTVQAADFFPHTFHVESLAIMTR